MHGGVKLFCVVSAFILLVGCEAEKTSDKVMEDTTLTYPLMDEVKKEVLVEEEIFSVLVGLNEEDKIKKENDTLFLSDVFLEKSLGMKKAFLDDERIQLSFQRDDQVASVTFKENSYFITQEYRNNLEEKKYVNKLDVPYEIADSFVWFPMSAVLDTFNFEYMTLENEEKVDINISNLRIEPVLTDERYEVDGDVFYLTDFEIMLFYLTNNEREKVGFLPLMLDIETSKVARIKSQDLHDNDYFEHNSETLGTPFDMLKNAGVTFTYAGENLAAGYENPEDVMKGWLESPGHEANIMRREFERMGIGAYFGIQGYERYFTQIFTSK